MLVHRTPYTSGSVLAEPRAACQCNKNRTSRSSYPAYAKKSAAISQYSKQDERIFVQAKGIPIKSSINNLAIRML